MYTGWGGNDAWFPGIMEVDNTFKEKVGSYKCASGTVSTDCPGSANMTVSGDVVNPTVSQH